MELSRRRLMQDMGKRPSPANSSAGVDCGENRVPAGMSSLTMETADLFQAWKLKPSEETLIALLGGLQGPLRRLCYRVLGHSQDAEDAAQKVLLELLKALPGLPDLDRVRGWLYRASILTAISLKKSRKRRRRHESAERPKSDPSLSDEDCDAVHRQIADLDDELRRVVIDYYFERKTLAELAAGNRCSTGAVWKKLQRALELLRRSLSRAGIAGGAAALVGFLEACSAGATAPPALSEAVLEQARRTAGRTPRAPAAGGMIAAASIAASALAVASLLLVAASRHRNSPEEPALRIGGQPAARPRAPVVAVRSPAKAPAAKNDAIGAREIDPDSLLARLVKLREIIDACLAKKLFDGSFTRAAEPLHPLVLKEPETYITFIRLPENRKYLGIFLDLLEYPDPIVGGVRLPDLPNCISDGLAELLASGSREDKLVLFEKCECLRRSFREYPLIDAFIAPSLDFVAGSDAVLRRAGLGFLFTHGHQDRLDLLESVWQCSRDRETRRMCLSFLSRATGSAGGMLFYQYLDEVMKEQDERLSLLVVIFVRDRLEVSNTEEDQDRCIPLIRFIALQEKNPLEFRARLELLGRLSAAKQAVVLRDLLDHAPSAELKERMRGTLALIAAGETHPGVLSELLMFGNRLEQKAPAPPVAESPKLPEPSEEAPPPLKVDAESSAPNSQASPAEVYSKDRKLKAILKKGTNGFASEFQIWDTVKDVRLIRGHHAFQITAMAISDDRKLYATADAEGYVSVRSLEGSYSNGFQSAGPVTALSFSSDGRWLQSPLQSWNLKR
jgi:RNA polymerase sigma factor (sigma-70 family)